MLSVSGGIFSRALEARDLNELRKLFGVTASGYWDDHFVFGKKCRPYPKTAGRQASDLLLINAVIPAIFAYGKVRDSAETCERALSFLEETAPEENTITAEWEKTGIRADSAFMSQGLLQLRKSYCRRRRCLECRIGARLISMGASFRKEEELMLEP